MSIALLADLELPGVILLLLTSLGILLSQDERVHIVLLPLQYLGTFILVTAQWPLALAVATLLSGWVAVIVIWMAWRVAHQGMPALSVAQRDQTAGPIRSMLIFRFLAATLVGLSVFSVSPLVSAWIPGIALYPTFGGLILIGLGLLQLGLNSQPLKVIVGLLTVLAGFDIIYAAVEESALVTGMLALVTMGMALVAAYLLLLPRLEEGD